MCDGSRHRQGLVLSTDNFSNYDVARLINVLVIKYDIKSRMHFNNKMPPVVKVKTLVMPHMCTFSLYKPWGGEAGNLRSVDLKWVNCKNN